MFDDIVTIGNNFVHARPNPVDDGEYIGMFVLAIVHLLVGVIQILPDVVLSQDIEESPR